MIFSDIQQEIYDVSKDAVIGKLDEIISISRKHQSALNAACFLLSIVLNNDRNVTSKMADILYPEQQYTTIRKIYLEIHELINNTTSDKHPFVKHMTDPRFFPSESNNTKFITQLREEFSKRLTMALQDWLKIQSQLGIIKQEDLLSLKQRHSRILNQNSNPSISC